MLKHKIQTQIRCGKHHKQDGFDFMSLTIVHGICKHLVFPCIQILLASILLFAPVGAVHGQDFEVSGFMTLQSFTQSRKWTQHFEIAVSGCRSLILSSNSDGNMGYTKVGPSGGIAMTNDSDRVSQEVGIENGTIYHLTRFFHNGTSDTAASIEPFEIPGDTVSGINYLWYAFASSCYFNQQKDALLEPIWTLDDRQLRSQHFKEKAEWILNKAEPFLPRQVTYYSDGLLRSRANGVAATNPAAPPYDHGFTNFTYEMLSSTNLAGVEIPAAFRFTRYSVATGRLTPIYIVTGKIEKFGLGTSVSVFRPEITDKVSMVDKTYSASNPPVKELIFSTTNGTWDSTNLGRLYRQRLKQELRLQAGAGKQSRFGILTMAVMSVISIALFFALLKFSTK